ncbi:hypothetical protein BV25DRAFT_1833068 [Artomyces pyxidatus]|uniref:Uncharacterized protein n=1 Tax=Artomyces pyxidatus TaxID=48021 RepID=A0ACB8SGZ6_9AGAM|nr:hypothetical protein BV25DRAFT_1833068 [Artomyces pyxidatus]
MVMPTVRLNDGNEASLCAEDHAVSNRKLLHRYLPLHSEQGPRWAGRMRPRPSTVRFRLGSRTSILQPSTATSRR